MSAEIIHRPAGEITEKIEWSKAMAPSSLLPRQYQGNPANLLFAVEYADALGIERINAITSIHVIEGKPSASAELIAGLVRRAGHKLRISGDDTRATAQIVRADDPDFTYEATWTMDRAKAAGLTGKGVWKSYPAAMLRARAITEVARMGASDALLGVVYTPEELGAEVGASGEPARQRASGGDRLRAALAPTAASAAEPDVVEAEIVEDAPADVPPELDLIDPRGKQMKALHASLNEAGLGEDRDGALRFISETVGREVESSKALTKAEASDVLDALKALTAGTADALDSWAGEGA